MKVFTIGFTQKSAEEFFETLKENKIDMIIDIRLNNTSQLSGFAKGRDLKYFLDKICGIDYRYDVAFAPTKELLDDWKKRDITWEEYESIYRELMLERHAEGIFLRDYPTNKDKRLCFLCSEKSYENCHRKLLAEYLIEQCRELKDVKIIHI